MEPRLPKLNRHAESKKPAPIFKDVGLSLIEKLDRVHSKLSKVYIPESSREDLVRAVAECLQDLERPPKPEFPSGLGPPGLGPPVVSSYPPKMSGYRNGGSISPDE